MRACSPRPGRAGARARHGATNLRSLARPTFEAAQAARRAAWVDFGIGDDRAVLRQRLGPTSRRCSPDSPHALAHLRQALPSTARAARSDRRRPGDRSAMTTASTHRPRHGRFGARRAGRPAEPAVPGGVHRSSIVAVLDAQLACADHAGRATYALGDIAGRAAARTRIRPERTGGSGCRGACWR